MVRAPDPCVLRARCAAPAPRSSAPSVAIPSARASLASLSVCKRELSDLGRWSFVTAPCCRNPARAAASLCGSARCLKGSTLRVVPGKELSVRSVVSGKDLVVGDARGGEKRRFRALGVPWVIRVCSWCIAVSLARSPWLSPCLWVLWGEARVA